MYSLKRLSLLSVLLIAIAVAPAQQPLRPPPIPEGCKVLKDQAYGEHERNKLDLYVPKSDTPLPLVIWIHGGGWEQGSKAGGGPSLDLLRHGYAVASINYRLSKQGIFPAQIEDCQAAVRWLRSHAEEYNLDPDHFGAWGASAGGHLVACCSAPVTIRRSRFGWQASKFPAASRRYATGSGRLTSCIGANLPWRTPAAPLPTRSLGCSAATSSISRIWPRKHRR